MIRRPLFTSALLTLATLGGTGLLASTASAQTVQLPTFRVFSVGTTVSVPDRGGAFLGGVHRGADGSVQRGVPLLGNVPYAGRLFRNQAIGSSRTPGTISVHATIIDFEELEQDVLAEAIRRREARLARWRFEQPEPLDPEAQRRAEFLSRNIGRQRDQ